MIRVNQVKMPEEHTFAQLRKKAAQLLGLEEKELLNLEIIRQSIDARRKPEIFYIYSILACVENEEEVLRRMRRPGIKNAVRQHQIESVQPLIYRFPKAGKKPLEMPAVIVGAGPAGLFCGYFLALYGYRPILLERGKPVEERREDVERFWREGILVPDSNVQFGEGGAGAFSDGKLNTLVKDKDGRNRVVLEVLVKFGAKSSILYEAKPHIGTDVLCDIVKNMRLEILRLGGEVRFQSRVTDILTEGEKICGVVINQRERLTCSDLVLAIGHSARDTFSMLYERGIPMEAKSFAVGLRVQHPQEMINISQYGREEPGELGAAPYKVAAKAKNGRGVYSFCMCPGGYVVNASSEAGMLAVNGMSYSGRDSQGANSAIIVSVTPKDYGSEHPLSGIAFQRMLEKRAYELGKGKIPVQSFGAYREGLRKGDKQETALISGKGCQNGGESVMKPLCKGAFCRADVSAILPEECNEALLDGMEAFGRQIEGFDCPEAILMGVESRTSSPVRIHRDDSYQSAVRGLYPCGEGAGYAGGITSAAMDGLRIAEAIAKKYAPPGRPF